MPVNKIMIAASMIAGLCSFTCQPAAAQKKKGWKLIWQEEFNYTGLPDTSKWSYEVGHVRNREQQYYTNARPENIQVADGLLHIKGRKEDWPNAAYNPGSREWNRKDSLARYTSASINTNKKFAFTYGRIEVRAKLPAGGGMWPAIWMLGADHSHGGWPMAGEIDIMEFIGNEPSNIYGTIHWGKAGGGHTSSGSKISAPSLHDDFHVYAVEWNRDELSVWFDDSVYHRFPLAKAQAGDFNAFRHPFYILLNLAMGADWPGPIDDSVLPQELLVDWVRVYQPKKNR
ncbi:Glycosyl hydrolases family 16 [Chitinophaga terrae (ex Kim and Jung 2007)]|uniref:Glycosyl hydrolases family 16 n=1 Tax=Chitinophaga terrae (ex Kim and Jung 2007) TaxID=408074 RepID=A0A1H4BAP5_9BACT|nr:glycoside hydrolase family 16 protein [Chitinophaga terrae (ex Kim and Jung 2007)]SEA45275.1 Glycosyl hydrolases family 16 [Chitinophaga terrae (ex Kim and Jung 2007)]